MATTPVTTEVSSPSIPPSVVSSPAPAPAETSSATATPQSTTTSATAPPGSPTRGDVARDGVGTAASPAAAGFHQESELSPQDFDSLEAFAQALIDKKQSEVSPRQAGVSDTQQSAKANSSTSSTDQQEGAPPATTEDQTSQPEEDRVAAAALPAGASAADLNLESEDFLSAKALDEKISANPALKQALEADQPLREAMFRNARLASEAAGYKEIFPDVNSARYAADLATGFTGLEHAFLNAENRQGVERFMGMWKRMAMMQDDNGNLLLDQHGQPQIHRAWNTVNQHIFDAQMDFIRNQAERNGDHELVAALDVVRETVAASAGLPAAVGELPPHLRAAADSIHRREQELARQQHAQQARDTRAFDASVSKQASEQISAFTQRALEKAALSDFVRQTAQQKIESAITSGLRTNRFFQSRLSELNLLPQSEETMRQRLNLIMTHAQQMAGPIVRQVLREASQPVIKAQEDRRAKIESQIARTRSEPKSVGGAASPGSSSQTPEQLLANAKEQLRDELGEEPNMSQVIERFAKLRKATSF